MVKKNKRENLKNVFAGTGISRDNDPYKAGKEAAEKALRGLYRKKPVISYVFYAGGYDPYKLSRGVKEVLSDTEFVGGSAPSIFQDGTLIHKGVLVISFYSEFFKVGVASCDGVTEDPFSKSKETTLKALNKIQLDKYLDPYLQFSRLKKGNIRGIIKVPTFVLFVFTRGFKLKSVGREVDIINGISDVIGQFTPIFGGSLGVPLEKVFKNEDYDIYTLHSGKVMKDGMVVVILNSGLIYANSLAHGCLPTQKMGFVSKTELGGYVVSEISGKHSVDWYSEALNISKKEFIEKIMYYTQKSPIAIPDGEGNYVLRAGGMPYPGDKMSFVAPFKEGMPVVIMNGGPKKIIRAPDELKTDIELHLGKRAIPIFGLGVMCASREIVLKEATSNELIKIKKALKLSDAPFVGFYSFGEIGSKPGRMCKFNHLTANVFLLYDKLITDL